MSNLTGEGMSVLLSTLGFAITLSILIWGIPVFNGIVMTTLEAMVK